MSPRKPITHCFNCGNPVENTEIHTYYCDYCKTVFVLNSKNMLVLSAN